MPPKTIETIDEVNEKAALDAEVALWNRLGLHPGICAPPDMVKMAAEIKTIWVLFEQLGIERKAIDSVFRIQMVQIMKSIREQFEKHLAERELGQRIASSPAATLYGPDGRTLIQ